MTDAPDRAAPDRATPDRAAPDHAAPDHAEPADSGNKERLATYGEFWPFYLAEHQNAASRRLHYLGAALTLPFYGAALATLNPLWLLGAPVAGYFFAWLGHFAFEKNKPATFKYPFWSLISDYRMCFLGLTGRLDAQFRKAGLASIRRAAAP